MTPLLEKIEQQVKELSREERERLIADLVAVLEGEPLTEIEQAWIDEAERRYDDLASGRVKGIPAQEAINNIMTEGCIISQRLGHSCESRNP